MVTKLSKNHLLPAISVLLALLIWWGVAESNVIPPYFLPGPAAVFSKFLDPAFLRNCLANLALTLGRGLTGYSLAAVLAIPIGLILGRSRTALHFASPLVEFLRPLPSSAIIPVALLLLGLGWEMKVAVVAFGSTWPILVATIEGAKTVDDTLADTARLLRLNLVQRIRWLYLPWSAPFIAAGLRTSLAVGLILAVTVEMIAGSDGIGFLILDMERAFRAPEMYAAILALGVLGYWLNWIFLALQRRVVYWQP